MTRGLRSAPPEEDGDVALGMECAYPASRDEEPGEPTKPAMGPARRPMRWIAAVLCILGLWYFGQDGFVRAKAWLAQAVPVNRSLAGPPPQNGHQSPSAAG